MRYQQDLPVALRERLRRLLTAHWEDFNHQLDLITAWISKQAALMAILTSAERVEPGLDHAEWINMLAADRRFDWPARTEEGKATLCLGLMRHLSMMLQKPSQTAICRFAGPIRAIGSRSAGELKCLR